jgi:lambda family phage tail tape measure protein
MADLTAQMVFTADASGVEAGVGRAKRSLADLGAAAATEGKKAADGLSGIGAGTEKASAKADAATRNLQASLQRYIATLESGKKTGADFYESVGRQRNANLDSLKPLIDQARALEAQTKKTTAAVIDFSKVTTSLGASNTLSGATTSLGATAFAPAAAAAAAAPFKQVATESAKAGAVATASLQKVGVSAGQTAQALRQLPAQFSDIVVSLQGGQRPLTVLLQQGAQIKDSFGGVGNALKAVGSYITPVTLGLAGLGAGLAVLGVAASHAETLQRSLNDLQAQLSATGRAGLISNEDLKKFINTLALAPGVTRDSATAVVAELAKVHNIGKDLFKDLAASAADYAKATGTDLPTAAKTLAKAFDDPAKGAKTLDDALGTLTSTQLLNIESLTKANDLVGAQRALYDALQTSIRGVATNALTPLQIATNDLGNAWEKAMQSFDKQAGLQNATSAMTILLVKMTEFINFLPEFEKRWKGAFTGGLNGAVMGLIGLKKAAEAGPQTGGATGSWGDPVASTSTGAPAGGDDSVKRALELGKAFQGQADKVADLTKTRKTLTDAMALSITLYGKESEQAKKLKGQIEAVDEAIKSAQKKLAGPAPKAFHDDAGTKMLESLKQNEASLKAQLETNEKLTDSEKERAKFVQLIEDLKTKGTLTADQKSLLASQAAIKAQLDINVGIAAQIELKKQAVKLAEQQLNFEKQMQGIALSVDSANESRAEQYDRTLSTAGLGARARQEVEAQKSIRKEYDRFVLQTNKAAADASTSTFDAFSTDAYKQRIAALDEARESEIRKQQDFYAREKENRENWVLGAREAFANYADEASNAAKHTEEAFGNALRGIEDQLTNLFTGKKFDYKALFEQTTTDLTRNFVKENIVGPLAKYGGDLLGDGGALASLVSGGKGSQLGSTAANAMYVRSADGILKAGSSALGGGSGSGGLLGSLFSAFTGGGSGVDKAVGLANASGGGLDDLFKFAGNFSAFASGGYTGDGGKDQPAGIVHAGEYVFTKEMTKKLGVDFLEKLGRRGYAAGGYVTPLGGGRPAANDMNGLVVHQTINFQTDQPTSRKTQDQLSRVAGQSVQRAQRNA